MSMLETKYLYSLLLLFTLFFPLIGSWESKLKFRTKWQSILLSSLAMMIIFIPWDIWFTHKGVWWFNHDYTLGVDIFKLPLEEWLFFLIIPLACLFIYESLNYFISRDYFAPVAPTFFALLSVILGCGAFFYSQNLYTVVTFSSGALLSAYLWYSKPSWLGKFLQMYLVVWLPFLLVNGALTGGFTSSPVVNYSGSEIIGLRVFSIPIEDSVYNLLMLGIVMIFYKRINR